MPAIACTVFSRRREATSICVASICVVSSNVKYANKHKAISIVIATIAGDYYTSPWV